MLPNCPFTALLDALAGTELTSLVTDQPSDAEELAEYTESKIVEVARTHAGGHPRGVTITFEVYVG